MKMKKIILYYSFSGKTAVLADELGRLLEADVIRLNDTSKKKGFARLPELMKAGTVETVPAKVDLSGYGEVFIGGPNWGGKSAPPLNSFIERNDFSGKQVKVFVAQSLAGAKKVYGDLAARIEKKGGKAVGFAGFSTLLKSASRLRAAAGKRHEFLKEGV